MNKVGMPYFDPDFDNLRERIFGPTCRVVIDNESMEDCTVVKVDSVKKQGLLLEVVQILTDMNLLISKSYISSDAGWFMDVFHVTDEHGNKLTDQRVINYIQQAIGTTKETEGTAKAIKTYSNKATFNSHEQPSEHTAIEMTGNDRPGLFSEISAALADLQCNIVEAHAWSHNDRLACVAYVTEKTTHNPIDDPNRLATIEHHLTTVLRATLEAPNPTNVEKQQEVTSTTGILGTEGITTTTTTTMGTNMERRLHQLMHSARDFDRPANGSPRALDSVAELDLYDEDEGKKKPHTVSIENCDEKEYSIVSIDCTDRPRLMFDVVCTLTDMDYVIFHASTTSRESYASQEYFIRHADGYALIAKSEKERVIKCLEAAIERRVCEGIKLEMSANNRVGLLSDITRLLRENGLAVVRADIATQGKKAVNAFYVRDMLGNKVDNMEFIESMKKEMAPIDFSVTNDAISISSSSAPSPSSSSSSPLSPGDHHHQRPRFSLGDMLRNQIDRISHNFIPIK
ncbi:hypothetical protein ACFE04_012417 [Oxalis oulophora]